MMNLGLGYIIADLWDGPYTSIKWVTSKQLQGELLMFAELLMMLVLQLETSKDPLNF